MTKKLQPTRSLRSLLFGGPHLNTLGAIPMDEYIRRLRSLDAAQNMGGYTCSPVEFTDMGRMVRWKFHVEVQVSEAGKIAQVPINGSFTLQGNGQVRIKARIGPDVREVYGLLLGGGFTILAISAYVFFFLGLPSILVEQIRTSGMATGVTVLVVLLVIFIAVMLVVSIGPRVPYFPGTSFIGHLLYHLNNVLFYRPPTDTPAVPS
ncbi:MAG: hypothetical protein J0M33_21255 [Anaerolineae bacterium]|nr:hypothetical protein [Anaerolineae bacterium]